MMIETFRLERFFSEHEFSVEHNLAASDCEPISQAELIAMAGDDELELWEELKLGYTETGGALFLREEIARIYQGIKPEQLLVCTPVEGIFLAMNAILEPGDHVICCYPEYQALSEVARAIGCEVERWEADEKQGWRFDPRWLERHARPDTRLIVINFPHNPTGCQASLRDLERTVEIARKRGAYLFSDEMYMFLEQEPGTRLPSACDVYERAVCLFGMSKAFGMAGARIGWLATRDAGMMERLARLKDYTTICSSAPSEVLATIALKSRGSIVAANLERIGRNLDVLDDFFERYPEYFYWDRPGAGTVAFPRLLSSKSADEFCGKMISAAGVLLLPASMFDFGQSHFRVGFGREGLAGAVEALEEHLPQADL